MLSTTHPNLFTWNCKNHHLKLAVPDAVDDLSENNFKAFVEKIHNPYSQSNKNSRELLEAAQEAGSHVQQIDRTLNTQHVENGFRAVKAV